MADLAIPDYLLIPETCKICGVYSPTWFTDSDLWNLIDEAGILCPACFITKAEKAGVKTTGWKLIPEERVEKAESEARQLREQLEEANASKVVNLYRQPEIDALRSQLERLQSGFDALCTAHADLGQQAAKLEAQLEAGQDKCANCGKTYSLHLKGTYCRIGSDAKWFPQKLADAIVKSTQKTAESA